MFAIIEKYFSENFMKNPHSTYKHVRSAKHPKGHSDPHKILSYD
jgi:hypothetical protein